METITVILLLIIVGLVLFIIFKTAKEGRMDEKIQSTINEKFVGFQDALHRTMETARREVEMSKNIISDHAIKTLDTIKNMGVTLERMLEQQKEASDLGNSLKYLLQTPKLRGSYGEEVLEEMLDRVLPKGVWEKQYAIEGRETVDAVVKYKDIVIPIDAKFPREIYERYLNVPEGEEKKKNWKLYEEGLKVQISSIKNKYIKPHKGTSDFALMFIPSESIYYETIAEKNFLGDPSSIYEFARSQNVVPVSPNTFYAFLQIIILGIRNIDIIKSAKKLREALIKIERNFKRFYSKYEEIGACLDKARNAYKVGDTHISRFKDNIESTLKLDLPNPPQIENSNTKE
ncbi:MAG: DNA recombination protein RmuC [Candidatus Omnitrophica bacterium]|nr:DNA recombination protein RmuC [Candidatus Omnitrophota bacterium]